MFIKYGDATGLKSWDEFVINNGGSIFQRSEWLQRLNGFKGVLIRKKVNEIIAGVPVVLTRKKQVKGIHIPPYTHIFCPVFSIRASSDLKGDFLSQVIKEGYQHIDFKFNHGHQDILPFLKNGFTVQTYLTYIVEGTYETFRKSINKNKLRELRKLEKLLEEDEIQVSEDWNFDAIMEMMTITAKRGNFNASREALKSLFEFKEDYLKGFFITSRKYGLVSIGIFAYDDTHVYNLINVSKRIDDAVIKTINLLTIDCGVRFALNNGKIFDFEGSVIPGIAKFYSLMGGSQVAVYRAHKSRSILFSFMRAIERFLHERR